MLVAQDSKTVLLRDKKKWVKDVSKRVGADLTQSSFADLKAVRVPADDSLCGIVFHSLVAEGRRNREDCVPLTGKGGATLAVPYGGDDFSSVCLLLV